MRARIAYGATGAQANRTRDIVYRVALRAARYSSERCATGNLDAGTACIMTTKRSAMPNSALRYRNDEGFAMAVVISVILVMFIMLAAVTLPLSADLSSSIRLGKVADERQLAESVMNELFSQAAKSSDLNLGFRMVGRVRVPAPAHPAAWTMPAIWPVGRSMWPTAGSFEACGSITELCFFYSPQLTSGSPFVTVEVTTRSACRADGSNCVFRRFQQSWRRRGFVDYVIFTDMETLQPELYGTGATDPRRAATACEWSVRRCHRIFDSTWARLTAEPVSPTTGWCPRQLV